MLADGSNGSVEFLGDRIIIRRKGFANKLTQGFQGDKTIMVRHITGVQFRAAGSMLAGSIQFTVMGGREYGGGLLEATKDENAVLFAANQQPAFETMRDAVQDAIADGGSVPAAPAQSAATELASLADLVEKGFLSREEFEEQKQRLLSCDRAKPHSRTAIENEPVSGSAVASPKSSGKECLWAIVIVIGFVFLLAITGGSSQSATDEEMCAAAEAAGVDADVYRETLCDPEKARAIRDSLR